MEIGEICIKGPAVFRGYYGQNSMANDHFEKEYFPTGDFGFLDEDGDHWIVQRRSDLVVSGGENIYPSEIEMSINKIIHL